jgi:undecaprenyl-diphosphatase
VLERKSNYTLLFYIFLISITIFRFWFIASSPFDLAEDEAHYWEWSRNLDISYYSKGPVVAYIIFIFTSIFGSTEFGVRFGAVAISAGIAVITYYFISDIFDKKKAFYSVILLNIIPVFAAGALIMTIDPPYLFFWSLALFFTYKAVNYNRKWWYAVGIALGMGLLTKYTMAMFIPLLFLFLLLSKTNNHWLVKKEPYLAVIIGLMFFTQVIIWNIQHDWVSFRHVAGQAGISDDAAWNFYTSFMNLLEFAGSQIGIITPLIFIGMIYASVKAIKNIRQQRDITALLEGDKKKFSGDDYLFLIIFSLPVFLFFLLYSFYSKVQANWAIPAYFTGLILTAAVFDELYKRSRTKLLKAFIISSIGIAVAATAILHNTDMLKLFAITIKHDPTAKLRGWRELGNEISRLKKEMKKDSFIFSDKYQIASELAFYVNGQPTVYCANLSRRLNQYDFWDGFEKLIGRDALYIKGYGDVENDKEIDNAFSSCKKLKAFVAYDNGYKRKDFSIFKCSGFKGMEGRKDKITY